MLQAREVWVEGSPVPGNVVTGRVYYFGGSEVRSRYYHMMYMLFDLVW